MNLYDVIFYLFAIITLGSAALVVSSKNIVHSAFYLLFTFFGVAGIYALLGADFVAVVQLLVYVGGILILLLFGVMLTNKISNVDLRTGTIHILPAAIGVGMLWGALTAVMTKSSWLQGKEYSSEFTAPYLGKMLTTDYVLIFELLGTLLLIALVAAASIARRDKE